MQSYRVVIDEFLRNFLNSHPSPSTLLNEALEYGVITPGKRIRPCLTLHIGHLLGISHDSLLAVSGAIELIHCYSLIHDDLPSMDNSPVRHGRPSSHIKYGEGLATLVGDALQPLAFQMITSSPLTDSVKVKLIKELAIASGKEGMVAGQVMDILSPETELNLEQLTQLHKLKTGELLAFSCGAPALIAGLSDQDCHGFKLFGYHLGLLYQVTDDLLDAGSNDIGKPTGQDLNKKTILTFMSTNKAIEYCEQLTDQAITALPESYRDKLRPIIKDIQNRII